MEFPGKISWLADRDDWTFDVLPDAAMWATLGSREPVTVLFPGGIRWNAWVASLLRSEGGAFKVRLVPTGAPTRDGVPLTEAEIHEAWIDAMPNVQRTTTGLVITAAVL